MNKIKKFKINIRQREVSRLIKKTLKLDEISSDIEQKMDNHAGRLQAMIEPAVVYETFPREKLSPLIYGMGPKNQAACTLYCVTVGEAVESEIKALQGNGGSETETIVHCSAVESVEQSVNFIKRLIKREAEDDSCEILTENTNADNSETNLNKIICSMIPCDKAGIFFDEKKGFAPVYSVAGLIFWIPIKKRKK